MEGHLLGDEDVGARGCCRAVKYKGFTVISCGTGNRKVYLGPHFIIAPFTYALVILPTIFIVLAGKSTWYIDIIAIILGFITMAFLTELILSDPGIVHKQDTPPMEDWVFCARCDSYKPPRSTHCDSCQACIEKLDHHCVWITKCVGQKNVASFRAFLFALGGQLCFDVVAFFVTYWLD